MNLKTSSPSRPAVGVVGPGRLGVSLTRALKAAGWSVDGPAGRGEVPSGEVILLCVPDAEIPAAAEVVTGAAPFVGHTSGATSLGALAPAGVEALGLHPLQTFTGAEGPEAFFGVGCAVEGSTPRALELAEELARGLGMEPFELDEEGRDAYHAAASMASNFLVTLEAAAEQVASGAGLSPPRARALLGPLVARTVDNWAALGPERALTGPVARGDDATVQRQRAAVEETAPELLELFDALMARTRALAGNGVAA
ncbi:MAG: DUF2520 domain-containing protein [Actinomycetota bacterium]|nr:DUF2520 domain-containing protein [Actinomycetota bacterium]